MARPPLAARPTVVRAPVWEPAARVRVRALGPVGFHRSRESYLRPPAASQPISHDLDHAAAGLLPFPLPPFAEGRDLGAIPGMLGDQRPNPVGDPRSGVVDMDRTLVAVLA